MGVSTGTTTFVDEKESTIHAHLGNIYVVNLQNSVLVRNHTLQSDVYDYENVLDKFDDVMTRFEYPDSVGNNFTFSVRKIAGILHFTISMQEHGRVDKMFLKFVALGGIFNTDMRKQLNVSILNDDDSHDISEQGDEYGILTRDCQDLIVELNVMKVLSFGGGNGFFLQVKTIGDTSPKKILLNEWNSVSFPSSYSLETGGNWKRLITLSFPSQIPICSAPYPQFNISEMNNVHTQDVSDTRFNANDITILRSFMYHDGNNLLKSRASFNFLYQFPSLKDIYGNDVEVLADTLTCGSTYGSGYQYGTLITPITPNSVSGGEIDCGEAVFTNNSLIIIYGKLKKDIPPKHNVLTLFDDTFIQGLVKSDRGVYMMTTIHDDTCVAFNGKVLESPISVYMLQQNLNMDNPILPTKLIYTEKATVPIGDVTIKFCANETVFSTNQQIDTDNQQMVFFFIGSSNETGSQYEFHISVQPYWRIPVIVGVCVGIALLVLVIFGIAFTFWLCTRKKKYAYAQIQ